MMRLFIALPLDQTVDEQLGKIILLLKQKGGAVRWVAPKNIHMTLRFLGDTDESKVLGIREVIDRHAAQFGTVSSQIDRLCVFPNLNRPNVIWVGLQEKADLLAELANRIEGSVRELGFEPDRKPFKAHLTLGRVKDGRDLASLTNFIRSYRLDPIPLKLDRIVLFK
ncbi:MAG TPA: RNA 2',3'-cyclic phosphodiesterase, partial [Candidatus Acidoferrum sp.]|nr:RNA 2',3'-cyclic phosphodiesterase [Candidatus Acidoferrum sp.]